MTWRRAPSFAPTWQPRATGQRGLAALLAALMTLASLSVWRVARHAVPDEERTAPPIFLRLLLQRQAPVTPSMPKPAQVLPHPVAKANKAETLQLRGVTPPLELRRDPDEAASPASREPQATVLPAHALDGPTSALKLDPKSMAQAYQDSRSELDKRAEAAGRPLQAVPVSKYELYQAAAADAAIPGCLRPDGLKHDPPHLGPIPLGGLLAVPFVAHAALTGKCK